MKDPVYPLIGKNEAVKLILRKGEESASISSRLYSFFRKFIDKLSEKIIY